MAYATLADLEDYTGQPPVSDDDRKLQRASDLIDAHLIGAVYAVDGSGNPTDPDVIAALRDAACAQVEWWKTTGDELGYVGQWQDISLGPARLSRRSAATTGSSATPRLAARVGDILLGAGLRAKPQPR
jgi:hypothetical protein